MFTSSINWADVIQMLILPIVLPAIVGLVTNGTWPTLAKRLVLGGLVLGTTVLTAVGEYLVTQVPADIGGIFLQWLITWGLAELAYWGILKAPITPAKTVETPIVTPSTNPDEFTKPQLLSLVENVTGSLPASTLTKPQLAAIVDDHTAQVSEVTYIPGTTIAQWLAARGNKKEFSKAA